MTPQHQAAAARDAISEQLSSGGSPLTTAELRRRLRQTGGRGRRRSSVSYTHLRAHET